MSKASTEHTQEQLQEAREAQAQSGKDIGDILVDQGRLSAVNLLKARAAVFGLKAVVNLFFQEQANDRLTLNGLGGDDVIDATSLEADGIQLTMNGGLGADVFLGSEGNDLVNGGDGNDLALMGAGDDAFVWNPGDDNDTLEGQAGFDAMVFNGANVAENVTISANGGRVIFFRDVASVTMDLNDMESVDFNALGGADTIVVNDLAGTDVAEINLNLAAAGGAGDGAADTVIINAANADDVILVVGDSGAVSVLGLPTQILYFLGSFALAGQVVTGVLIWWKPKRAGARVAARRQASAA